MNVADICPVGALTTRDFRFKIRVWFTDDVESVCNQCSRGCNIVASRSNNKIYRFVPRRNDAVNDTWMCDHGRMSYKKNSNGRLASPRVDGREASYTDAVKRAAELVRATRDGGGKIVGVASVFASNADLEAFRDLLARLGAGPARFSVPRGESDAILIEAEKAPNAAGCRALGMVESNEQLGRAELALVLGHTLTAEVFGDVKNIVLIDTHESALSARATVALPARTFLEKTGSFTNSRGLVQPFSAVVEPAFEAWSEADALAQIAAAAGIP
jgi:NADH-quinone oxidoreductase subunit G